jgi:hypothetical protein
VASTEAPGSSPGSTHSDGLLTQRQQQAAAQRKRDAKRTRSLCIKDEQDIDNDHDHDHDDLNDDDHDRGGGHASASSFGSRERERIAGDSHHSRPRERSPAGWRGGDQQAPPLRGQKHLEDNDGSNGGSEVGTSDYDADEAADELLNLDSDALLSADALLPRSFSLGGADTMDFSSGSGLDFGDEFPGLLENIFPGIEAVVRNVLTPMPDPPTNPPLFALHPFSFFGTCPDPHA